MNNNFSQLAFIKKYNEKNRERFNPTLFERTEEDIIFHVENIILSSQRNKFFTIRVDGFTVINDYGEVNKILYDIEEYRMKNKNKRLKFNCQDYINLKDSDLFLLKVDYHLEIDGKSADLPVYIALPKIVDKYYFKLAGSYYCPMYQIVDGSTYNSKKKNPSVVFKTPLMRVQTYQKTDKLVCVNTDTPYQVGCKYFTSVIFSNTIYTIKYFLAKFGLMGTMGYLDIREIFFTNEPMHMNDSNYYCFTKNNKLFITVVKEFYDNNPVLQALIYTILVCTNINKTSIDNLFNREYWLELLGQEYRTATVQKGESVLDSLEHIYDEYTKSILRLPMYQKDSIYAILRWNMYEFDNLIAKNNCDISTKRIRLAEYIAALYAMKLSTNIYGVANPNNRKMEMMTRLINAVDIRYDYLINELKRCNIVPYRDGVNDNDALNVLKFTYKGISGIGEKKTAGVPDEYRFVNGSHLGRVDRDSSANSDPGMNGTLCPYMEIYENGYLSNFKEPCTWDRAMDTMYENYKKARNIQEVFQARNILLGENNTADAEIMKDTADSISSMINKLNNGGE